MKRILLVFAILFCCNFMFAQDDMGSNTDAGTIFLHGASGLNISFSDGTPIFFNASAGYFFADKILGGANIGYNDLGEGFDGDFNLGVFGRYYVTDALFLGATVDLGLEDGEDTNVSAQAGYNIFLNDSVSLEPSFVYPFQDGADPFINMGISVFL